MPGHARTPFAMVTGHFLAMLAFFIYFYDISRAYLSRVPSRQFECLAFRQAAEARYTISRHQRTFYDVASFGHAFFIVISTAADAYRYHVGCRRIHMSNILYVLFHARAARFFIYSHFISFTKMSRHIPAIIDAECLLQMREYGR